MRAVVLHGYGEPEVLKFEDRPEPVSRACRVITTAGRDESIAVLRVDEVIDYRTTDFPERARELTDGKGIPVVLDTVGGDVFLKSLDCASVNGHIVTIVGSNTADCGRRLLYRNATLHYEFMGVPTAQEIEPERPGQILAGIANLVDC
jgi:NADPH2:quinone reductase